jgi:hypothetical protein
MAITEEDMASITDKKITASLSLHIRKLMENGGSTYVSEDMAFGWCRHIPKATGGNTRNKMQRFCCIDEKRCNKEGLSVTPCRARGRDIPQHVWTALGLSGRPHLDSRNRHACGWVVCPPSTPIELLRWYECDNEDDPFVKILTEVLEKGVSVKKPRVMTSEAPLEDYQVEDVDPVTEILAKYSSPSMKRSVLSRYAKAWHLRENYRMTQEEREALLDGLYKKER